MMKASLLLLVAAAVSLGAGCGASDGLQSLPRYVARSMQRDFPECDRRDVRGIDLGGGRYRVVSCDMDVVYVCPTAHARWRGCQLDQQGVYAVVQPEGQTGQSLVVVEEESAAPVVITPVPQNPR